MTRTASRLVMASMMLLCLLCRPSESADDQAAPYIPAPSHITAWVKALECRDLLTNPDEINQTVMLPFAIWLHGYAAGLGSALPLEGVPAGSFDFSDWIGSQEFDGFILAACAKHMDASPVETAIDVASLSVNALSKKKVLLRGTNGKWE
jgi:hypothetical protein